FAQRYGETADKMGGPWRQVANNLKAAWDSFVDFVNFIDWSKLKSELNWIADKLAEITSALPGARAATKDYVADDVSKAYGRLLELESTKARFEAQGNRLGAAQTARSIQEQRGIIALGETRLAGMQLVDGTSEL